jgi:hypothetical protein
LDSELRSSLGDVKVLAHRGIYKNASFGPISRNGKFAAVRITVEIQNRRTASLLAMAIYQGKFVKVRLSTPDGPRSSFLQTSFLNALSHELGM